MDDEGKPIIDCVMVEYLGWATAIATKVNGTPDMLVPKIRQLNNNFYLYVA